MALRPEYHPKRSTARKRPSGTTQAVSKVRGMGADKARLTPKRTADEKKARAKPAVGRLSKAGVRRGESRRSAAATVTRGKPVKRGARGSKRAR